MDFTHCAWSSLDGDEEKELDLDNAGDDDDDDINGGASSWV